jgi:hypothetical protein
MSKIEQSQESVSNFQTVDFILNLLGLCFYVTLYAALLYKHKCKIDFAAIIICSIYPIGTISQIIWRIYGDGMNPITRSFIIIFHDFVVVAPSYFIFEMEKVKTVIQANNLQEL